MMMIYVDRITDRTQNSTPNGRNILKDDYDNPQLIQSPVSDDLNIPTLSKTSDSFDNNNSEYENNSDETQQEPSPENEAYSLIKLDNGDVLYMREVNR